MTVIYYYDPYTFEYLGEGEASYTPLSPDPIIPSNATLQAPPEPANGFVRKFIDGSWVYASADVPTDPPTEEPTVTEGMIRAEGARRLTILANGYFPQERETWPRQIEESRALLLDANAPAPGISALAAADGITPAEYAQMVMNKNDGYSAAAFTILARQRSLIAALPGVTEYKDDALWS